MIAVSSGLKVLVATKPIDFRKGMDGLAALVKEHLGADPFSGAVFVFRAKRADRIKLIVWDGTGLCLFQIRLAPLDWPAPRKNSRAASSACSTLTARAELRLA